MAAVHWTDLAELSFTGTESASRRSPNGPSRDKLPGATPAIPIRIAARRVAGRAVLYWQICTTFVSKNALSPSTPSSRPSPDCLTPPNGACGSKS